MRSDELKQYGLHDSRLLVVSDYEAGSGAGCQSSSSIYPAALLPNPPDLVAHYVQRQQHFVDLLHSRTSSSRADLHPNHYSSLLRYLTSETAAQLSPGTMMTEIPGQSGQVLAACGGDGMMSVSSNQFCSFDHHHREAAALVTSETHPRTETPLQLVNSATVCDALNTSTTSNNDTVIIDNVLGGGCDIGRGMSSDVGYPFPHWHLPRAEAAAPSPTTSAVGGRWPRQETLTLLDIRKRLDPQFREATQKAPLWEQVSRIMAEEHGYQRSAKKCREKLDNLYKYYKKTKQQHASCSTTSNRQHYRFFRQLDALYGSHVINRPAAVWNGGNDVRIQPGSAPPAAVRIHPDQVQHHDQGHGITLQATVCHLQYQTSGGGGTQLQQQCPSVPQGPEHVTADHFSPQLKNQNGSLYKENHCYESKQNGYCAPLPSSSCNDVDEEGNDDDDDGDNSDLRGDEDEEGYEVDTSTNDHDYHCSQTPRGAEPTEKGSQQMISITSSRMKEYAELQLRRLMEMQEMWLERVLEALDQMDREQAEREEDWRKQEAAKSEREQRQWADHSAAIQARHAAIIRSLEKSARGIAR